MNYIQILTKLIDLLWTTVIPISNTHWQNRGVLPYGEFFAAVPFAFALEQDTARILILHDWFANVWHHSHSNTSTSFYRLYWSYHKSTLVAIRNFWVPPRLVFHRWEHFLSQMIINGVERVIEDLSNCSPYFFDFAFSASPKLGRPYGKTALHLLKN